jgi:putative membrane protein
VPFWIGLIVLAVWLIRWLFTYSQGFTGKNNRLEPSVREVLDTRYARGEITREQYELMKSDLG